MLNVVSISSCALLDLNLGSGSTLARNAFPTPKENIKMPDPLRIACSLGADELRRRLDEIATVGAESLTCRVEEDGVHSLRFRSGPATSWS